MGYYRQHGKFVGSYESCSTAAFKHGRTETVRPASLATVACSQAFDRTHKAGVDEMTSLIQKASEYHNQLIKEAAMGFGVNGYVFKFERRNLNPCKRNKSISRLCRSLVMKFHNNIIKNRPFVRNLSSLHTWFPTRKIVNEGPQI
ncbi:Carnitine O-palmitoyltransferase 2, mitochondrial, partial [Paramuricea clavata]